MRIMGVTVIRLTNLYVFVLSCELHPLELDYEH